MAHVEDTWVTRGTPTARFGRGKRWRAVWTGLDGKRHSRAIGRRSHAEQYADYKAAEVMENAALWRELDKSLERQGGIAR
jgi:hypothetical protein